MFECVLFGAELFCFVCSLIYAAIAGCCVRTRCSRGCMLICVAFLFCELFCVALVCIKLFICLLIWVRLVILFVVLGCVAWRCVSAWFAVFSFGTCCQLTFFFVLGGVALVCFNLCCICHIMDDCSVTSPRVASFSLAEWLVCVVLFRDVFALRCSGYFVLTFHLL